VEAGLPTSPFSPN